MNKTIIIIIVFLTLNSCNNSDDNLLIDRTGIEENVSPKCYPFVVANSFNAVCNGNAIAGIFKNTNSNDVFYYTNNDFHSYNLYPFTDKINFEDSGEFNIKFGKIHYWNNSNLIISFWSDKTPDISRSVIGLGISLDMGKKWYVKSVAFISNKWQYCYFGDASFVSENDGWVIVSKNSSNSSNPYETDLVIFKEQDTVLVPLKEFSKYGNFKAISRVDPYTAWIVTAKTDTPNDSVFVFFTSDAGNTWAYYPIDNCKNCQYKIKGFPGNKALLMKTTGSNAGQKIIKFSEGLNPNTISEISNLPTTNENFIQPISIFFIDENNFYLIYLNNNKTFFYKTSNAGQNWQLCYTDTLKIQITNIYFSDIYNGIAWGYSLKHSAYSNRVMFRTSDGGQTWDLIIYPFPYVIN